jgi:cytochrome c biogenesis protein CcmG, thiol:disulfide interchange protein DsbE
MNWKRAMIGAAIAAPMVGLLAYGMTQDPRDIPSPLPGRGAPGFALRVFASGQGTTARQPGDTVRLADLRGDVVVLNFWASWCLACRDEHEALSHTAKRYAGKGVHFVGVLYNDVANAGFKWIEEMGGQSYPSVLDPRARTAIDYGLYGVPETFFIGRDGRVGYKHVGPVSEALLAHKIDSLLAVPAEP